MIEEQKAKALFAGGIALFVVGLVVLMLFVIPAARHTQVAMAQDEEDAAPEPDAAGEVDPGMDPGMEPGREPGMEGMLGMEGMPGAMPGGGGGGGVGEVPPGQILDPLEASRPNPFSPRSSMATPAAAAAALASPHYGPDWSQLPIAERVAFVRPDIPSAPTPALPRLDPPPESQVRITSILWDASGQAMAAYEDPDGKKGELKPGDRVPGTGLTVREITRVGATLENPRTGETQELELRPRVEKKEEPPQRQPRRPSRGGSSSSNRGGFPGAPPGG